MGERRKLVCEIEQVSDNPRQSGCIRVGFKMIPNYSPYTEMEQRVYGEISLKKGGAFGLRDSARLN
jgi:hypothetical protein